MFGPHLIAQLSYQFLRMIKQAKKKKKKHTMGPKCMFGPHLVVASLSYPLLRITKVNITSEKERKDIPWGPNECLGPTLPLSCHVC